MIFFFIQRITWIICNLIGKFFLNFKVEGKENLKNLKKGGVIFVSNHSGRFDPFLIGAGTPPAYFRCIKGLRHLAFFKYTNKKWYGPIIRLLGAYPVYKGKKDLAKTLEKTVNILKDNYSILMFPTSRISRYFDPDQARPGIAYLAQTLNPLIVPVFVKNAHRIKFKEFLFRSRKTKVIFGPPFYYQEVASREEDSLRDMARKIMERVEAISTVGDC